MTIILKHSGHIDIYWNNKFVTNSEETGYVFSEILVNFSQILIEGKKKESNDSKVDKFLLHLSAQQRISFNDLIAVGTISAHDLRFLSNHKYKDIFRPYQSILHYNSFLFVAHGNVLSYYDIDSMKWKTHHKFVDKKAR